MPIGMQVSIRPGPWPGPLTKLIIVIIVIIVAARWAPRALLPLGAGTWLMAWLAPPSRPLVLNTLPGGA